MPSLQILEFWAGAGDHPPLPGAGAPQAEERKLHSGLPGAVTRSNFLQM